MLHRRDLSSSLASSSLALAASFLEWYNNNIINNTNNINNNILVKNLRNELFDTQVAWVKEKVTFLVLSLIFQLVTAVGAAVTIILITDQISITYL